jgi:5-hydroxyisourate hydrolase
MTARRALTRYLSPVSCRLNDQRKTDIMANGYLTTHVLDTARGQPASGVPITLYRIEGDTRETLAQMVTNADGRTDAPILPKDQFATGFYELVFDAGSYLDAIDTPPETPRFLDQIPLRFGVSDPDAHYHVPLLLSPFGYSTYRGS